MPSRRIPAFTAPPLSRSQLEAVARWQSTDRFYREAQNYARTGYGSAEAARVVRDLTDAIRHSRTTRGIVAWRGNRSCLHALGVSADQLSTLIGREDAIAGFMAASLDLAVVTAQFVEPEGPGGAVIHRLRIPAGTRALWVAALGDPSLMYQQEVLLDGPVVRYSHVDRSGPVPILEAEVMRR